MNLKHHDMATLKNSIMEAVETGINNALTSNITKEEALEDYNKMNDLPSMPEKKAMAAKYGIDSKKAKDIQDVILKYLRTLRFSQNVFDEQDVRNFDRLGWYDSYKKEAELFEQEPKPFLEYLKNYRFNRLKQKNLDKYVGCQLSYYRISLADKSAINRYNNIKRYFDENSSEYAAKMDAIDIIYKMLQTELADYKKEYLEKVRISATKFYNDIPANMERYKTLYDEAVQRYKEWESENPHAWREGSKMREGYSKLWTKYADLRATLNRFSKEEYVADKIEDASKDFDNDTKSVAIRINDRHVDATKLKVLSVNQDPKYFEMMLSDGTQKFYARSIFAAAESVYMVPHYRFIITDRSKF